MGEERESSEGLISPDELLEEPIPSHPIAAAMADMATSRRGRQDPRVGTVLDGRFKIQRLVARGGMGKIYEAGQHPLGRRVALKVMDLGYAEDLDPDFQKRFFLEASTCASLSHPNTIRVFDYGHTDDETYYIVMEFIDGETLLNVIDREAPLDPLRVIHIARQVCASLAEAHGQGVIHRDLKPSNVLLTRHGEHEDFAKVLDFGLVKLLHEDAEEMTKSGLFLGSPNYMSPEQIRSNKIDQRADLYSLGVILYMALTGKSPFKRNSSVNVLLAQLEDAPPPFVETLPAHAIVATLEWVVMTCLAKDPAHRFSTVQELSRALKAVEAELHGQIAPIDPVLEGGRLVLTQEASNAIATVRWSATGPGPRPETSGAIAATNDPISSAGSIVSNRLRQDVPPAQAREPSAHRTSGTRARRRKKRSAMDRILGSPLFAMFMGAIVVLLIVALTLLIGRVLQEREGAVVEEPAIEQPTGSIAVEDLPMPPQPDAAGIDMNPRVDPPTPVPGGVEKKKEGAGLKVDDRIRPPRRTERAILRSDVRAGPSAEPEATPSDESATEATPEPRKPRGDLRDPWDD